MRCLLAVALVVLAGCSSPAQEGCIGTRSVERGEAPGLYTVLRTQAGIEGLSFMHLQPEDGLDMQGIAWPEGYDGAVVQQAVRAFMVPRVDADGLADLSDGGIWFRPADGATEVGAAIPARLDTRQREEAAVEALAQVAGLPESEARARAPEVLAAAEVQAARIGGLGRTDPAASQAAPTPRPRIDDPMRPASQLSDPAQWDYVDCEAGYCQVIAGLNVLDIVFPVQTMTWTLGSSQVVLEVDAQDRVQVTVLSPGHSDEAAKRLVEMTMAASGHTGTTTWHATQRHEGQPLRHVVHGTALVECV